jgi:hypothetical protein
MMTNKFLLIGIFFILLGIAIRLGTLLGPEGLLVLLGAGLGLAGLILEIFKKKAE